MAEDNIPIHHSNLTSIKLTMAGDVKGQKNEEKKIKNLSQNEILIKERKEKIIKFIKKMLQPKPKYSIMKIKIGSPVESDRGNWGSYVSGPSLKCCNF